MIKFFNNKLIEDMYLDRFSSYEIKEILQIDITARQIQRIVKSSGISRTKKQAKKIARAKGRLQFNRPENIEVPSLESILAKYNATLY